MQVNQFIKTTPRIGDVWDMSDGSTMCITSIYRVKSMFCTWVVNNMQVTADGEILHSKIKFLSLKYRRFNTSFFTTVALCFLLFSPSLNIKIVTEAATVPIQITGGE